MLLSQPALQLPRGAGSPVENVHAVSGQSSDCGLDKRIVCAAENDGIHVMLLQAGGEKRAQTGGHSGAVCFSFFHVFHQPGAGKGNY